jgi:hypothetical protein
MTEPATRPEGVEGTPPGGSDPGYDLKITRLTIDKLGVKLYDKVSAVVAEVIANSYDADATEVTVELPLGTELASRNAETSAVVDRGLEIVVRDNGHGMTPAEAREHYLQVGRDRRLHPEQGDASRTLKRPVMGRKGIGKLAPFGICRRIEILSSGGPLLEQPQKGYLTSHFFLDYGQIIQDSDEPVHLPVGELDGTIQTTPGTIIRLTSFLPKRVPDPDTFHRQVSTRFAFADPKFDISLKDTRSKPPTLIDVKKFDIAVVDETRVDVSQHPLVSEEGESLPMTGWLALARDPYKNEELAGVRIYARSKIVATTRDFEQPAGFTGEFTMRSYLVGEIFAEWIDEDEDLIRTDRQSILWDSDRGRVFRDWGAKLIKGIAAASAKPRRANKSAVFMAKAKIQERAAERYVDDEVVRVAVELGQIIGGFAAEDELGDPEYVDDLAEVILSVAPHQALVTAFRQLARRDKDASIEDVINLFGKTRVAELASYAQIAAERVASIAELQETVNKPGVPESELQRLIASAPWLIKPDWSVITENQSLATFRDQFVAFWKKKFGTEIEVAISLEKKRPDFTLVHHGRMLHLVELKAPGHAFGGADYSRLENYVRAFDEFFEANKGMAAMFPDGWRIDLIADGVNITDSTQAYAFSSFEKDGRVVRQGWNDFLAAAVKAHEEFLVIHTAAKRTKSGEPMATSAA